MQKQIINPFIAAVFFLCCIFFPATTLYAQNDTPCECAQRWANGGHWRADGTVNDSSGAPLPRGIIRCGTAADNQSNIAPAGCVYNSSQFTIDLTGRTCTNPNTGLPANITPPLNGCPIIWFNFDVRGLSGRYNYQIVTNDNVGWALYFSDEHQNGVDANGLSGDCSSLSYWACGSGFDNTFAEFTVPVFTKATNLYLAVWDLDCTNPATFANDLKIAFKAKDGCGNNNYCLLEAEAPTTSCNPDGGVTLAIPINGINSNYQGYDPNATPTTSNIVTLSNVALGGPTSGVILLTYPHNTLSYNVTIQDVVAPANDIVPLNPDSCNINLTGTLPFCCPDPIHPQDVFICDGECFFAEGNCQSTSGTYTDILTDQEGCDSIIVTNLQVANCDDGDPCTEDICSNGNCSHFPVLCADDDLCTTDGCVNGQCEFEPVVCGDGDDCTADGCVAGECVYTSIDCADIDLCTDDYCLQGFCLHSFINCEDGDLCTDDVCENGSCLSAQKLCDDGQFCTTDVCVDGSCEFNPNIDCIDPCISLDCSDNDPCTIDACTNGQCGRTLVACNDDDLCTSDVCVDGFCEFHVIPRCNNPCDQIDCNDFNPCTDDACANGECFNTTVICADTEPCTIDVCIDGACEFIALDCDDEDPCTNDNCLSACVNEPVICDDQNNCTTDECIDGACESTLNTCKDEDACTRDFCLDAICYNNLIGCVDNDPCTDDACIGGNCEYTEILCEDFNPCTIDACAGGDCQFTDISCDDQSLCTADECIGGTCFYFDVDCNDGNECTIDACEPASGCVYAELNCDDFNACTIDNCDELTGCVYTDINCDDFNACTIDACEPVAGCFYEDVNCDDFNACTIEKCDPASGCEYTTVDCEDYNTCTLEYCDPAIGCVYNDIDCNDFNACTNEYCDPASGCEYTTVDCEDYNACTLEYCDPAIGCVYSDIDCNDFNACTNEYCDPASGCEYIAVDCEDYNACTLEYCDPAIGCIYADVSCDDLNACTTEFCDPAVGCLYETVDCNDWNACTDDACEPAVGCYYTDHNCDDANACTLDGCDILTGCVYAELNCDDGDGCTLDGCDPLTGCTHTLINTEVAIETTLPATWCQSQSITLTAQANSAIGYTWSTGATTQSIEVSQSGQYSVTVEIISGCMASATLTLADDFFTELLASYTILAEKEVHLHNNKVFSGAVGANGVNGKIKLNQGTKITAPGSFVKGADITLNGASVVTTQISAPANVALPPFEYNPSCSGQDLNLRKNTVITLTGSVYGDITIDKNSVVTFTQSNLYIKNLHVKDEGTVKFANCTRLHICKKLHLDKYNSFNPDGSDVVVFVEENVEIGKGSKVTADLYVLGKLSVEKGEPNRHNIMTGLFIANHVHAGEFTDWYQNNNCGSQCLGSLIAAKVSDETSEENAIMQPFTTGNGAELKAYPNPFTDKLNIEFTLAEDSRVQLEIFNLAGQRVATLFEGNVQSGELQKYEFAPDNLSDGMFVYRLQTASGSYYGKAVMLK